MKKLYLILLVFVFNSIISFGSEQIELSARLGKTISLDSRNYFGLFPDVKDFKSAVLFKDVSINYIEITAGKSEEKSKIILSDSAVSTLAYVIDNFEGIISEPTKYKLNGKLISGLIRISTQFNKKAKPMQITLRDSTKFSGFILYADSSVIVTTPESAYRPASANFKITGFSDIYSISNVDYPIIDGTKAIFVINKESFLKLSLFKNANGIKVAPPEVLKFVKELPIEKNQNLYKSPLDYDKLYFKRIMVSANYSYQLLYKRKFDFKVWNTQPEVTLYLTNYYSLGFNINYRITGGLSSELGYNYELISYNMGGKIYSAIYSNTFNFNVAYNFWHSKKNLFEYNQLFTEIQCGVNVHNYKYKYDLMQYKNDIDNKDITANAKFGYLIGARIRYKINKTTNLFFASFINYYNSWGELRGYDLTSENITNNFGYGISAGFGFEL